MVSQFVCGSYPGKYKSGKHGTHAMQEPTPPAPGIPSPGTLILYSSSLRNKEAGREIMQLPLQKGCSGSKVKKR